METTIISNLYHPRAPGLNRTSSGYGMLGRTRKLLRTFSNPLCGPQLLQSLRETPITWLSLYFLSNLTLTLYNKSVLIEFPFPYTLTALHALCSAAGSSVLLRSDAMSVIGGGKATPSLNWQEAITLVLFSMLFTVNIAVSNISLDLVTVPVSVLGRETSCPYGDKKKTVPPGRSCHDPCIHCSPIEGLSRFPQQSRQACVSHPCHCGRLHCVSQLLECRGKIDQILAALMETTTFHAGVSSSPFSGRFFRH